MIEEVDDHTNMPGEGSLIDEHQTTRLDVPPFEALDIGVTHLAGGLVEMSAQPQHNAKQSTRDKN
jgi:hypothetical protein